jgi:hypothetical protein
MGNPQVRFSDTIPKPVDTVPILDIHQYCTVSWVVLYDTHGNTDTHGFLLLCLTCNLVRVLRASIDACCAVCEVIWVAVFISAYSIWSCESKHTSINIASTLYGDSEILGVCYNHDGDVAHYCYYQQTEGLPGGCLLTAVAIVTVAVASAAIVVIVMTTTTAVAAAVIGMHYCIAVGLHLHLPSLTLTHSHSLLLHTCSYPHTPTPAHPHLLSSHLHLLQLLLLVTPICAGWHFRPLPILHAVARVNTDFVFVWFTL